MPVKILLVSDSEDLEKVWIAARRSFAARPRSDYPVIDVIASSDPSKIAEYLSSKKMVRQCDYVVVDCENKVVGSEVSVAMVDKFPGKVVFMITGNVLPVITRLKLNLAREFGDFVREVKWR